MQYNIQTKRTQSVDVQFFKFEHDFVEDGIRCIPMIVRYKLDVVGIKLKLKEWNFFEESERELLAQLPCGKPYEITCYRNLVTALIKDKCNSQPAFIPVDQNQSWSVIDRVDPMVVAQAEKYNHCISVQQWAALNTLQRFALLKLCRPGHENRNFRPAMIEFELI